MVLPRGERAPGFGVKRCQVVREVIGSAAIVWGAPQKHEIQNAGLSESCQHLSTIAMLGDFMYIVYTVYIYIYIVI